MTYWTNIVNDRDPHYASAYWRNIREQCLARDGYRCRLCNSPDELQAHHRTYDRKGREDLEDLTTLCRECHDVVTDHQRRQRYATRVLPIFADVSQPLPASVVSTYKEVVIETSTVVSVDRSRTAHDALWTTRRSFESLDESH